MKTPGESEGGPLKGNLKLAVLVLLAVTVIYGVCTTRSIQAYEAWKEAELVETARTEGGTVEYWRGILDFYPWHMSWGVPYTVVGVALAFLWLLIIAQATKSRMAAAAAVVLLLSACGRVPVAKASGCTVNVIVALDEELRNYELYNVGIPGLPVYLSGWDIAALAVEAVQETYQTTFAIAFQVTWAEWDSHDEIWDAAQRALEAHNEIPHEGAMLWALTNQEMSQRGRAIPWEHVAIIQYTSIDVFYSFSRRIMHEVGHLFNLLHCDHVCLMNPAYVDGPIYTEEFCAAHIDDMEYWKWHWEEIPPPPDYQPPAVFYGGGGAGGRPTIRSTLR
jgi:hypothetical protein